MAAKPPKNDNVEPAPSPLATQARAFVAEAKAAEPPKAAEPVGPPSLDAKKLVALAFAIEALGSAKETEARLRGERKKADEAHDAAKAALDAARARVLEASTSLAGGDLADNFIPLSDDDAKKLAADAMAARRGLPEHVRAKLFG